MKCILNMIYCIAAGFIISTTAIFPPYFLVNVKAGTVLVSAFTFLEKMFGHGHPHKQGGDKKVNELEQQAKA